jgi:hypothetical protein
MAGNMMKTNMHLATIFKQSKKFKNINTAHQNLPSTQVDANASDQCSRHNKMICITTLAGMNCLHINLSRDGRNRDIDT